MVWPAANLSLHSFLSESDRYGLLSQIASVHIPQADELFADPLKLYPQFVSIYIQNVCLCADGALKEEAGYPPATWKHRIPGKSCKKWYRKLESLCKYQETRGNIKSVSQLNALATVTSTLQKLWWFCLMTTSETCKWWNHILITLQPHACNECQECYIFCIQPQRPLVNTIETVETVQRPFQRPLVNTVGTVHLQELEVSLII